MSETEENPVAPNGGDDLRRHYERWTLIGTLAAILAVPAAVVMFVMSLFSANACGMFADGCEDYGKPAAGFEWFASGTMVAVAAGVTGIGIVVWAVTKGYQRRPR